MTRRRSTLSQLRKLAYRTQRDIGDVQAAERGPAVLAKRIARRQATRAFWRLFQ